ncbi:MAG: RcnB family protein [Alphaproteobacteria bacterium]
MTFHDRDASSSPRRRLAAAVFAVAVTALAAGGALADPPPGKGKGNKGGGNGHQGQQYNSGGRNVSVNFDFSDHDRVVLGDYYGGITGRGHCPPGLAKKNNGCMPPGQAKKWAVGQRLPSDVIYYDLPSSLTVRLTPPPSGYKYVRVAKDILLIAAGTGMVAAGLSDLVQ